MMTKDELSKSLAADFSNAVEATYQDLLKAAVAAEREACAQIVDDFGDEWMCDSHMLSKEIRARGNRT